MVVVVRCTASLVLLLASVALLIWREVAVRGSVLSVVVGPAGSTEGWRTDESREPSAVRVSVEPPMLAAE